MNARFLDLNLVPLTRESPSRARDAVATSLKKASLTNMIETAELIVSELVTNAVLHGAAPARVVVYEDSGLLFIEVYDGSRDDPQPGVSEDDEHGRGLAIVEFLAEDWASEQAAHGKCVWASLAVTRDIEQPAARCPCGYFDEADGPPTVVFERIAA